jgi:hypothetical protein
MRRETTNWDELIQRFKVTFSFKHEYIVVDSALQVIQTKIFEEEGPMEVVPMCSAHKASMTVHKLLECYNIAKEEKDEGDTRNVKVPETEGEHIVEGFVLEYVVYT